MSLEIQLEHQHICCSVSVITSQTSSSVPANLLSLAHDFLWLSTPSSFVFDCVPVWPQFWLHGICCLCLLVSLVFVSHGTFCCF